jgi:uncharacterized protein (TIGR02453 family)
MIVQPDTLQFLSDLAQNNNRDWFTDHKKRYDQAHKNMIEFADEVLHQMAAFDQIETLNGKRALKRIYRDVRFSKNKEPYKKNFGIVFSRATAARRGSYYIHIQPGNSFIGGGFWDPVKEDIELIRSHIAADDAYLRKVLESKEFRQFFGTLEGEQLKTAPKGYEKDHPAIDLLRYKQFLISKPFSDKEVLAPDFSKNAATTLKAMLPFFDVMTEMLTTNLNGESLVG